MSTASDNELRADLASILDALIADPEVARKTGRDVLAWLSDNTETVGEHREAYMAALAVRDGLAAIDSGASSPADVERVERLRAVPVAEGTAVALHVLCGYTISDTADMVRRPDYEVAGLVADFKAPPTGSDAPRTEAVGAVSDAAVDRPSSGGRRPAGRARGSAGGASAGAGETGEPRVRRGLLVALGAVVAIALILLLVTRVLDDSDSAGSSDSGGVVETTATSSISSVRRSTGCSLENGWEVTEEDVAAIDVDGSERFYSLFAPPAIEDVPRGLIVTMGDVGQTVDAHLATSQIRTLPVDSPMAVVTVVPVDGVPQWNVAEVEGEPDDVAAVVATIAAVGERLCIDLSRVYLVGVGAGGHLAAVVACDHGAALAGVAMVTGIHRPAECTGTEGVDALMLATAADDVFPAAGGTGPGLESLVPDPSTLRSGATYVIGPLDAVARQWAEGAGCGPGTDVERGSLPAVAYEDCDDSTVVTLVNAVEVGHVWPQSAATVLRDFLR